MIVDTHSHVYMADYDSDRAEVIDRAVGAGVGLMVLPGVDRDSVEPVRRVHSLWPALTAMAVGLHPTEVKGGVGLDEQLDFVRRELSEHHEEYVAVGEIGMDLYQDATLRQEQREAFGLQLELAHDYGLPVLIHNREALEDTLGVMSQSPRPAGCVFHCFGGSVEDVGRIRSVAGEETFFGIGGVVTFKNSRLREVLPSIGLDRIVLETDCPWLAPVPYRGKRNESGHLPFVVDEIARSLGETREEVERVTTENAYRLLQRRPVRS